MKRGDKMESLTEELFLKEQTAKLKRRIVLTSKETWIKQRMYALIEAMHNEIQENGTIQFDLIKGWMDELAELLEMHSQL
jgi:hypothetical protein